MSWFKDTWKKISDWWNNDVRGNSADGAFGDILQEVNEYLLGEGSYVGDLGNHVGELYNKATGAYATADYEDAISDENATVQFERQKELLALEQSYNSPQMKAQQLAQAGLNPALATGVSNSVGGASASMSSGGSARPTGNPIGDILGLTKMRNENRLTEAEVKLKDAQAKAILGGEDRASRMFNTELALKAQELLGAKLSNEYQKIVNYIADNTKEDQITQSGYNTQILWQQLRHNQQLYENLVKDGNIKDESLNLLKDQRNMLAKQIFNQEIRNKLDKFNYEQWTGYDYYSGHKIGEGLAQFLYDKEKYGADFAKFESLLKEKDVTNYDINLLIDNCLKVIEGIDIIHDDVYGWVSDKNDRDFQREMNTLIGKYRNKQTNDDENRELFYKLLPYIVEKLM